MTKNYQKHINATKKQVAKLLDLDENEEKILEAGMDIVATLGASEQGEKMNQQLKKFNRKELFEKDGQ